MNEENKEEVNIAASLEAILFLYGEPVEKNKLAKMLKIGEEEVEKGMMELKSKMESQDRGVMIMEKNGTYLTSTKPQFSFLLENFVKENLKEDLTPASLETLSLVSYFAPISRAQIDYIRGVNSSFILRNLLIRGLIERKSKGNMYLYEPSFDLLKYLGISTVSQLPEFEKFQQMKGNYFSEDKPAAKEENNQNADTKDPTLN